MVGADEPKDERRAIGGRARAESLPPERRSEIARRAAYAKWSGGVPRATHEGRVHIGNAEIVAAVLQDGTRLLSQRTFLEALGRGGTPRAASNIDDLPVFLQAEQLKPFISEELRSSSKPVFFQQRKGPKSIGYRAEILPMVCEVYLRFRDSHLAEGRPVPSRFRHIIEASDMLTRGLARVGIVALVDEATGFQEVRDRQALQAILDRFLRKELAAWAKRFPDEFYQQIFRLRGWEWRGMAVNRPQVVAHYTKDLVYARLAPGIIAELEARNPKNDRGRREHAHHQWLTEDVGHPALAQHLYAVIGFMRASPSWDAFMKLLNRAYPKRGDTLEFDFDAEPAH